MTLALADRTAVLGILNATDDSFSGDGFADDLAALRAQGLRMVIDGADALDVGAASSRPGHGEVPLELERERATRAVAALVARVAVPISVDSTRPAVVEDCLAAGASIVNDVSGLADDAIAIAAARAGATLVLVHGSRPTPGAAPAGVILEVHTFLAAACARAERLGVGRERLVVDPGLGFAKTPTESFTLLRELGTLRDLAPILAGSSRKGHLGAVTGRAVDARLFATAGAVAGAVFGGADIVRVHDVAAMVDVVRVADAIRRGPPGVPPPRIAFVGLGANLGDRTRTLARAVAGLAAVGEVRAVSGLWDTAPQLVADQPPFLNAVAAVRVAAGPAGTIVRALQDLERALGRTPGPRYGPRAIDLDLLLFAGSASVEIDEDVRVPHARLAERRFALAPLAELAPDERDPVSGRRIDELLAAVADQPARLIDGGGWWKTASR